MMKEVGGLALVVSVVLCLPGTGQLGLPGEPADNLPSGTLEGPPGVAVVKAPITIAVDPEFEREARGMGQFAQFRPGTVVEIPFAVQSSLMAPLDITLRWLVLGSVPEGMEVSGPEGFHLESG